MGNRILILGSNSFSGSHFVTHCLLEGFDVVGISRSSELSPVFLPYKWRSFSRFKFYSLDLNLHLKDIMQVINDFQPEYIVNFAAQSMVGESWNQPENWFMTNTVSTINFHDKLRHCSFIKKYIHISTPEVYGNCTGLVKENTNYNPSTPYAVSRAAADMSLMSFIKTYNFPVIFTRAANVYGAGQQLYRIIPRTIIYFLTGRKLSLHGGGHSERSFIHISDVCNGTLLACQKGNPGDIFHFSTSQIISIRGLVEKIATKMNIDFHKHVEIVGDRLGKDSAYLLDSSQAKIQLNWTNSVNIDAGIEETISWVTNNLDILKNENFNYVHKK